MAKIPENDRQHLIFSIVNLKNKDFDALSQNFEALGFLS